MQGCWQRHCQPARHAQPTPKQPLLLDKPCPAAPALLPCMCLRTLMMLCWTALTMPWTQLTCWSLWGRHRWCTLLLATHPKSPRGEARQGYAQRARGQKPTPGRAASRGAPCKPPYFTAAVTVVSGPVPGDADCCCCCLGCFIACVRGCPVVEINLEPTGNSSVCTLSIQGKAGELLPQLFSVQDDPQVAAALAAAQQAAGKRS